MVSFIVAGLNILTLSSSVANLLIDRPVLDRLQSSRWYWVGLVFTISRLLSVPLITHPIRDIIENRSQGESTKDLQHRIDMHRIRVFVIGLLAWMSFLAAVLSIIHP